MDRPCGCPEDYHLADCPILTSRYEIEEPGEDFDDEPPWGSFPEERGDPNFEGLPYREAVKLLNAQVASWM